MTNEETKVIEHYSSKSTNPNEVHNETNLHEINLNWTEKELPEKLRTKHVHRLHPYLGKFIPQLAEIFLRKYFCKEQTVLDPFVGSGTTLVQANELGINSIGSDISIFNVLLSKAKSNSYDIDVLENETNDLLYELQQKFHEVSFLTDNEIKGQNRIKTSNQYLLNWFSPKALLELLLYKESIENYSNRKLFKIILSRSARSARLTTHFDLDFPKKPITEEYWCYKHRRNCRPVNEAAKFLNRYTFDTVKRVKEFAKKRTNSTVKLFHGNCQYIEFPIIDGVITSPPYVGLIDYHNQHKYAYELLEIEDRSDEEIGAATNGTSMKAKEKYINEIAAVFNNVAKFLKSNGVFIVVAGDKANLYPSIFEKTNLVLVDKIERHVNRRTGRRSNNFFETVFIYKNR